MREPSSELKNQWMILPALALAAGGYLFGASLEIEAMEAAPTNSEDMDEDGLVDIQEKILSTSLSDPDSDGYGFDDLEEFSRGMDPMVADDPQTLPAAEASLAMTGRVQDHVFKAVTALYVPDGDLNGDSITFGIQIQGQLIPMNPMLLFVGAKITAVPGKAPNSMIYLLETPVPESIVLALGNVGLYATYSDAGATVVEKAASLNLVAVNGVVAQIVPTAGGCGSYRPLTDGPDLPATWTPAQLCVQTLETVGVIGPVIQQEVTDASCQTFSTDSYCPPDCVNLIGSTHDVVDPIGLIGG